MDADETQFNAPPPASTLAELEAPSGHPDPSIATSPTNPINPPDTSAFRGFVPNLGQLGGDLRYAYYFTAGDCAGYFGTSELALAFRAPGSASDSTSDSGVGAGASGSGSAAAGEFTTFTWTFPGGADLVTPRGEGRLAHHLNFYQGALALPGVPTYGEVWYDDLFPGTDLRFYWGAEGLKYEFHVHPGADPAAIAVHAGPSVSLDVGPTTVTYRAADDPGRVVTTDSGLRCFQLADGRPVAGTFERRGPNQFGYAVGAYDPAATLVIDPYWQPDGTYYGGSGWEDTRGMSFDSYGRYYITGVTYSSDFDSVTNNYGSGAGDAYVIALENDASTLRWITLVGGSGIDKPNDIEARYSGPAYYCLVAGYTDSSNLPGTARYDGTLNGNSDGFVFRLNDNGQLDYKTYLGGDGDDHINDLCLNQADETFIVTGETKSSTGFPLLSALDTSLGGISDAFFTGFAADMGSLTFSTYYGGSDWDRGEGVQFGNNGRWSVPGFNFCGTTNSADFPNWWAYQAYQGGVDGWYCRLDAVNHIEFSSFLGGSDYDDLTELVVDSAGYMYVAGFTWSSDPPLSGSSWTPMGASDGYVAQVNSYYFYRGICLGGSGEDSVTDMSFDGSRLYMGVETKSSNFRTHNAYDDSWNGGSSDAAYVVLKADDFNTIYTSSFLGGSGDEGKPQIQFRKDTQNFLIATQTTSSDFPVTSGSFSGGSMVATAYILLDESAPEVSLEIPSAGTVHETGSTIDLHLTDDQAVDRLVFNWDGGTNGTLYSPWQTSLPAGDGSHALNCWGFDKAGNSHYQAYTFYTDDTPPTITVHTPGGNFYNDAPTLDVDFGDTYSLDDLYYKVDSAAPSGTDTTGWIAIATGLTGTSYTTDFSLSAVWAGLGDGSHTVYFKAWDDLTNVNDGTAPSWAFTKDSVAPWVQLSTPPNGSQQPTGASIDLALSDAAPIDLCWYNWDGGANQTLAAPFDSLTVIGPNGDHFLNVWANDSAGNLNSTTFKFETNDSLPLITLLSPTNFAVEHGNALVNLSITHASGIAEVLVSWDGAPNQSLLLDNHPYYYTQIPNTEVMHVLVVHARNNDGNNAARSSKNAARSSESS